MKQYGLLGYPLSHSFSKGYFTEKFKREFVDAAYENFAIPAIEQFPGLIAENPLLVGLNVTIPYKQVVMSYLDELDPEAETIGAVNTIRIERQPGKKPRLIGYNSDLVGFRESIRPHIHQLLETFRMHFAEKEFICAGLKALILGTGGASRAVEFGLKQLGVETLYVSRTPESGRITYDQIDHALLQDYQIIVNTTPLGMYPNTQVCPPIEYSALGNHHLLFDAIYNPEKTLFLEKGEQQGSAIKNGLEMLQLQAEQSWKIWNNL